MRRHGWVTAALLALPGLVLSVTMSPAAAQPTPTPIPEEAEEEPEVVVPEPVPGDPQCVVEDLRLTHLSGLVAVEDAYYVINDGSSPEQGIFVLDQSCQVVDQIFYTGAGSRDPEDLELDRANNILWVADIGDNPAASTAAGEPRQTVALWRVDLDGDRTPVIHRFAYEDGQPRDAETLVLDGDGTPVIVTRDVGTAELFRPVEGPDSWVPENPAEQAVPLEQVGEFSPPNTGSDHDLLPSAAARSMITGGTTAPEGDRVVLRSYTDAFEFDVADGDVVAAITEGQPRITPLPGEPQGEAISYSPDGQQFLTISEVPDQLADYQPELLSYTPTSPPPETASPDEEAISAATDQRGFSLIDDVQDILNLVAAVGVLGLLLVAAGVYGIVRARRRATRENGGTGPDGGDGGPVTGRARLTGDPAGQREPGRDEPPGGVYGSGAARGSGGHYQGGYPDDYARDDYARDEYADYGDGYGRQREHPPPDHGGRVYGGREHPGDHYARDGYRSPPHYDRGWHDERAAGYGYPEAEQPGGYPGDPYQGYRGGAYQGGAYQGGAYQGGGYDGGYQEPDAPDYYSDDPDYPYEFRDPNRW